MRAKRIVSSSLAVGIASVLASLSAIAQTSPKIVTFVTQPAASASGAASAAIAKIVTQHSGFQVELSNNAGSTIVADLLDSGRADFGWLTTADLGLAFNGQEPFKRSYKNLRLVMKGAYWRTGVLVRKDSIYKKISDLKGKRIAGVYSAHPACLHISTAVLANGGLTWKDSVVVPVPHATQGVQAVMDGRAEAAPCALPNMGIVSEADARGGVRFLPIEVDESSILRAQKIVPVLQRLDVKGGTMTGVLNDQPMFTYQVAIVASKDTPDDVVANFIKPIWERQKELISMHPLFEEWGHKEMVGGNLPIPFHPGAEKFYASQGIKDDALGKVIISTTP
jgi:TRAP transporter TAXI family solute receptor